MGSPDEYSSTKETAEIRLARELLESLMSRNNAFVTYPFMDEVDAEGLGLTDYSTIVKNPMWLNKMTENFDNGYYHSVREFVSDFRLMLFNCYRYNGVSSRMGRSAEKLELMFEQKLQLLPADIRAKTSLQSTLGSTSAEEELSMNNLPRRRSSNRLFLSGDSRQMTPMRAIMEELEHAIQPGTGGVTASLVSQAAGGGGDAARYTSGGTSVNPVNASNWSLATSSASDRASILIARLTQWRSRREEEALLSTWTEWWRDLQGPDLVNALHNTQEMLEVYQFLWLADPFLGISHAMAYCASTTSASAMGPSKQNGVDPNSSSMARSLCLFDLELGLAVAPRASHLLAVCMSNLLATPKERGQIVAALSEPMVPQSRVSTTEDLEGCGRRQRVGQNSLANLASLEYDVWERRLSERVSTWYRALRDKGKGQAVWAARRLGIPVEFFQRCGTKINPLEVKRFHELSPYIRTQLLLTLCISVLRNFENLRTSLDRSADWEDARPVPLGDDLISNVTYVHFPGLLDIEAATYGRVYCLSKLPPGPGKLDEPTSPHDSPKPEDSSSGSGGNDQMTVELSAQSPSVAVANSPSVIDTDEDLIPLSNFTRGGSRRGRSRRSQTTRGKRGGGGGATSTPGSNLETLIDEHDQELRKSGLQVLGPVGRLPCWLPPSLSRMVHRRWFTIAQNLHAQLMDPEDSKLPPVVRKCNQPVIRALLSAGVDLTKPVSSLNGRGRGRGRGRGKGASATAGRHPTMDPLAMFERADEERCGLLIADDPALAPNPFGLLLGLSQHHLSLLVGRGSTPSNKSQSKSASKRRTARTTEEGEATAESTANATEDSRGPETNDAATSSSDDDEAEETRTEVSSASDSDEHGSERGDKVEPGSTNQDETHMKLEESVKDEEVSGKTDFEQKSDLVNNHESNNKSEEVKQSPASLHHTEPKLESASPGRENSHSPHCSSTKDSPKANDDQDESIRDDYSEGPESLIEEPDYQSFVMVAHDSDTFQALLIKLRGILERAKSDANMCVDTAAQTERDSMYFSDASDDETGVCPEERCQLRVVRSLEKLIQNLDQLHQRTDAAERMSERAEAQQLARLRLRKDFVVWEEKETRKKELISLQTAIQCAQADSPSPEPQPRPDLAKERAERQKRREMVRYNDDDSEEDCNDEDDDDDDYEMDQADPDSPTERIVAKYRRIDPPMRPLPVTPMPGFSRPYDTTGSPKVAITRASPAAPIPRSPTALQRYVEHRLLPPAATVDPPQEHSLTTAVPPAPRSTLFKAFHPVTNMISRLQHPNIRTATAHRPATPSATLSTTCAISTVNGLPVAPQSFRITPLVAPIPRVPIQRPVAPAPVVITTPQPAESVSRRKIYRVRDTLFTEDGNPVQIGSDGAVQPMPADSVSPVHRQTALQIIARYKQHALQQSLAAGTKLDTAVSANPMTLPTPPKRVAVTTGEPDPIS